MDAILKCRTEEAGIALYECEQCGHAHIVYRSCGNRHCPTCQHHKTREWLETQMNRQLPGHHFMLTFTVPESLRRFIRSHQRLAYAALFKASAEAIKKLAADDKHIGGDLPGFFGVLHTWGRTLEYHPHIHYIAAGGALSTKDRTWHPSRIDFYLPVRALSKIFRAKFRDEMKAPASRRDPARGLGDRVERQLPGGGRKRRQPQVSRSLCLQGGHLQQPHCEGRESHRHFSLPESPKATGGEPWLSMSWSSSGASCSTCCQPGS